MNDVCFDSLNLPLAHRQILAFLIDHQEGSDQEIRRVCGRTAPLWSAMNFINSRLKSAGSPVRVKPRLSLPPGKAIQCVWYLAKEVEA